MSGKLKHVVELVPAIAERNKIRDVDVKPVSSIQARLDAPMSINEEDIVYQHSVFCQTVMPYRDPGDDVREWQRRNGYVHLLLEAGKLVDPATQDWVRLGLPFGPKPRLVLYHLNSEALKHRSPHIELEDSLTAFVTRTLGFDRQGRTIRVVKDQLNRLAASHFRLGMTDGVRAVTVNGNVFRRIELWTPRDERQQVLWPTTIDFSWEYYYDLAQHAVPLVEQAVARLSHSSMALDVYAWLGQRLHRIDPRRPALIPWVSLQGQFGEGYRRLRDFRRVFERTLEQIKKVYPKARFDTNEKGMLLRNSPPPVAPRYITIPAVRP